MSEDKKTARDFVPPKKNFNLEMVVGLFTLAGFFSLAYLAVNIAGMSMLESGKYQVKAEFDNVSGLKVGAPVEIAGVQVGEVSNIGLKETSAVLTLKINDTVRLRDDDVAAIRTKGIIGDRYVKVTPGSSKKYLENGSELFDTESAVELEEVIGKVIHQLE